MVKASPIELAEAGREGRWQSSLIARVQLLVHASEQRLQRRDVLGHTR